MEISYRVTLLLSFQAAGSSGLNGAGKMNKFTVCANLKSSYSL